MQEQGGGNNDWTFRLRRIGELLGTPGGAAEYREGYGWAREQMAAARLQPGAMGGVMGLHTSATFHVRAPGSWVGVMGKSLTITVTGQPVAFWSRWSLGPESIRSEP
jgi:hypothetical protein